MSFVLLYRRGSLKIRELEGSVKERVLPASGIKQISLEKRKIGERYCICMNKDEQLLYADHIRHFYTLRYGFSPMVGRLLGYLLVCIPEKQSMNELAEALMASRSAIVGAVQTLENYHLVNRTRVAGQRSDSISLNPAGLEGKGFDVTVYREQANLLREGLNALKDMGPDPRIPLLEEAASLAEFLAEQIPALHKEWDKRRDEIKNGINGGTRFGKSANLETGEESIPVGS
jgi:hypothetical protein